MDISEKVKEFFDKIPTEELFLFKKLYNDPESILGDKQDMDEAEEEYNNLFYYYDLMMNNNLSDFIIAVSNDIDFRKRNDNNVQVWRKLNFFVYDSLDFKKYYFINNDQKLKDLLEDKITIKEYYGNNKPPYSLLSLYEAYNKYKKLFDYNYETLRIDNYDEEKAKKARLCLNPIFDILNEKLDKIRRKETAFMWIQDDDYNGIEDENKYLCRHNVKYVGLDRYILDMVCENEFLKIIEEKIDNNRLIGIALDNSIGVIQMGIDIKTYQQTDFRHVIDEEQIKNFDLEYAKKLSKKLYEYKQKNKVKSL